MLVQSILAGTKGKLLVESIENIGPRMSLPAFPRFYPRRRVRTDHSFSSTTDYARTLREWNRRFGKTFETDIVPALREAYPELTGRKEIEIFRRKWVCAWTFPFFLQSVVK